MVSSDKPQHGKMKLHKIAILGTPRAGKTSLMVRLSKGLVDPAIRSTRGIDFHVVRVEAKGIKLQIWDLAGQDHYRNAGIFDDMVLGASAFLFCYDASDASSIKQIDQWIDIARNHARFPETKQYLVGLKADIVDSGQQIGLTSLVQKYLDNPELNVKHIIASAHQGINIEELIDEIIDDLKSI
ncbi:MAG: Rab family GTPase [Candidatus Kariarchaeaceae archaeon]|jgi:small GTP-binding protein